MKLWLANADIICLSSSLCFAKRNHSRMQNCKWVAENGNSRIWIWWKECKRYQEHHELTKVLYASRSLACNGMDLLHAGFTKFCQGYTATSRCFNQETKKWLPFHHILAWCDAALQSFYFWHMCNLWMIAKWAAFFRLSCLSYQQVLTVLSRQ